METLKELPSSSNEVMKLIKQIMVDHLTNIDLRDELLNRSFKISDQADFFIEESLAIYLKELSETLIRHTQQWEQ